MKLKFAVGGLHARGSPPARGRGLKRAYLELIRRDKASPPARGRGLKPRPAAAHPSLIGRPPRGGVD